MLPDGIGQLGERLLIELFSGLIPVGLDFGQAENRTVFLCKSEAVVLKQGVQTGSKSGFFGHFILPFRNLPSKAP